MELAVISSPSNIEGEIEIINGLFKNGLQTLHLRKPNVSESKLEDFINQLPDKYVKNIVLHSHHRLLKKYDFKGIHFTRKQRKKKYKNWWRLFLMRLQNKNLSITTSFHSITSVFGNRKKYSYVFLSPVFGSISKKGYGGDFTDRTLTSALRRTKHKVYALGGVSSDNITKAHKLGFKGVALLGAIWQEGRDPIKEFIRARQLCEKLVDLEQEELPLLS